MGKFWKKNKAAISGVLLAILGLGGFIGLGYFYSKSDVGYDYVGVGTKIDSLSYTTGTGNMYQVTALTNEGLIVPSSDFRTLQADIKEALTGVDADGNASTKYGDSIQNTITNNNLVSIEEYAAAAKKVLEVELDNNGSTPKDINDNKEWNENEKALMILAADGGDNLDRAVKYLVHYRPITYVGDDATETTDNDEWDANGVDFWQYAYGVSDMIYTDKTYGSFRFRMRDGSLDDGDYASWESWSGHEHERVSAADVAFGMSIQTTARIKSSSSYMYTAIGDIKGASEIATADREELADSTYSDQQRYDYGSPEGTSDAAKAIYWFMPTDPSVRTNAFKEDESFKDFDSHTSDSGVVWYDPAEEENTEVTKNNEYSYVDLNLNNPNKTFATMMSSTGFWPVNWEWFNSEFSGPKNTGYDAKTNANVKLFGSSADTYLCNGAQRVTKFDNLYGYTTHKNENYWDADLVTSETTEYRMMSEASTEVAMFANGQATYINGTDTNTKVIQDNPNASKWLKDKLTKPANKFMFFNLGLDRLNPKDINTKDSVTYNAKFTSDPNFRRAIKYSMNINAYHQLNSTPTANPVSTFEPLGMYTIDGRDFVDYLSDVQYGNKGTDNTSVDSVQLEYYNEAARRDAASKGVDLNAQDPNQNRDLANYYFGQFLDDMDQLGVTVPDTITLNFLTSVGANDPFVKMFQQQLGKDHPFEVNGRTIVVDVYPQVVDPALFFGSYYDGDYDLSNIQWGADYLDVWSNIGIFNMSEKARSLNSTADWNFWDGSDFTFDDSVYGAGKTDLARKLFNDGLSQFHDGIDNTNINVDDFESVSGGSLLSDIKKGMKDAEATLWDAVLSDNDISSYSIGTPIAQYDDTTPTKGLSYSSHVAGWDSNTALYVNLILELLLKDGAATVTGTTESASISPSRAVFEGDPVIGYETRALSFDVTRINKNSFWKDVEHNLKQLDEFNK